MGGNWKMNGSKASIDGILKTLAEGNLSSNTGLCIKLSQMDWLSNNLPTHCFVVPFRNDNYGNGTSRFALS